MLLPRVESWVKQIRNLIVSKDQIPIRLVTTHAIAQIAVPALISTDSIDFKHMRPDHAYAAILHGEADIALVLDNAPWKGVIAAEIGKGYFTLFARTGDSIEASAEDQMEVLSLQQSWQQAHGYSLPVKSRIPSWSLIAHICSETPMRSDSCPIFWRKNQDCIRSYGNRLPLPIESLRSIEIRENIYTSGSIRCCAHCGPCSLSLEN